MKSPIRLALCWCGVFVVGVVSAAGCKERSYDLHIGPALINPDCSNYTNPTTLVVNGQLPGPVLEATQGDVLRVTVYNAFARGTRGDPEIEALDGGNTAVMTVHFHGIRQRHTNENDGVPYVTQNPIEPGGQYVYEFLADTAGTYFYHAHVGLQEATVIGPIIIHDKKPLDVKNAKNDKNAKKDAVATQDQAIGGCPHYDDERVLMLSEWYHTPRRDMERYVLGTTFTGLQFPSSILINGQTVLDTTNVAPHCPGFHVVRVVPGKTYRLRVIGATLFMTLGFSIADHQMTVIEADGTYVKPYDVDYLEVAPGQRYSVLVTMDQDASKTYAIGTEWMWTDAGIVAANGWAQLVYDNHADDHMDAKKQEKQDKAVVVSPSTLDAKPKLPSTDILYWSWPQLAPVAVSKQDRKVLAQKTPDHTITMEVGATTLADLPAGNFRYTLNGNVFMDPGQTLLLQMLRGSRANATSTAATHLESTGYAPALGTYPLKYMDVVDIVIQNARDTDEPCRAHPFHTHGHSHFWISHGVGTYNPKTDSQVRNIPHPILKDTTVMYPDPAPDAADDDLACGWIKLRILADNPGYWAFHCHITPHMYMGMMAVLEEATDRLPAYLKESIKCH
ncbi:Cupredoxin [Gongronella butleri]|nr:Cupredoxin [Gongronella butleri]